MKTEGLKRERALVRLWPDIGRDELGLSRTASYSLAARQIIPTVRLGRSLYVPAGWLAQYRDKPTG
jgi:hypothetical protein